MTTSIGWAQFPSKLDIQDTRIVQKAIPRDLSSIFVPSEIGKIQDIFQGQAGKVVILVQDAHSIPDAQRNIQKLITHFQKEYGIGLAAVEGAASKLDSQIFKSFPDKEALRKTFEEYLAQGEITGSIGAAIFPAEGGNETLFHGVEDWKLYEEGLGYYLAAMEREPQLIEKLSVLEKKLEGEKEAAYSPTLLNIDRQYKAFQENQSDLIQCLKALAEVKGPEKESELAILLEESEKDGRDPVPVEIEVRTIAKTMENYLDALPPSQENKGRLSAFHEKYQQFQTSRISAQDFALFLKELDEKGNSRPSGPATPGGGPGVFQVSAQLSQLMKNRQRMKDIEGTRLFRDIEHYAASVKETLFRNEEERSLDRQSRQLERVGRLIRLELSQEDWRELKSSVGNADLPLPRHILKANILFYGNAEKRDEAFFNHLTDRMTEKKLKSSLLIAGGFHTEGLTQRLKERDISYLLLMPRIDSFPEQSLYRQHMKGDVSWKRYLKVENGKINLAKAFVRGARDQLLRSRQNMDEHPRGNQNSGRARWTMDDGLAKRWRDQIIRDLAKQGKITEAGKYTALLDETGMKSGPDKRLEKVEVFIENLGRLEARGQLTQPNILKLLKPATVLGAFDGTDLLSGDVLRAEVRLPGMGLFQIFGRPGGLLTADKRSEMRNGPAAANEWIPLSDVAAKIELIKSLPES
ncbi:MAG TPA: hypothetical protein VD913_02255, partial [bacterium]|nr:hypothetical protein [bacterium]